MNKRVKELIEQLILKNSARLAEYGEIFIKLKIDYEPTAKVLDNNHCRVATGWEDKIIMVSKEWTREYVESNKPELLLIYPNYSKNGNCIVYVKLEQPHYGKPISLDAIREQFEGALMNQQRLK